MPLRPSTEIAQGTQLLWAHPCGRSAETVKVSETFPARGPDSVFADIHPQKLCECAQAKCSCTGCCAPNSLSPRTESSKERRPCSSNRQNDRPTRPSQRWKPCLGSRRHSLSFLRSRRTYSCISLLHLHGKPDRSLTP